ncbi:hypothetical protein E4T56_gene8310 [Termitomyces sp. T112]|nr:hypothetical protein E4T56_gene8310 [Termitomyces sp. T112]
MFQLLLKKTPTSPAARLPHPSISANASPFQILHNNFGLLKHSIKCDANQAIQAILQSLSFAQAVIRVCGVARGFSGSSADCAHYLGTMQLQFANQANCLCIAD